MVNVNPTNTRAHSETPEIRKYKKRFNSEILCAALWGKPGLGRKRGICVPLCSWSGEGLALPLICPRAPIAGVNLLVGTENGLMLLDRSGQGKVYGLIGRRRFQQMDVLEGLNLLITISGVCVELQGWGQGPEEGAQLRGSLSPSSAWAEGSLGPGAGRWGHFLTPCGTQKRMAGGRIWISNEGRVCVCPRLSGKRNKLRVYYLSWLRNKILHNDPEVEKKQGWTTVGDMEGCGHYRVGERSQQSGQGTFVYEKK